MVHLIEESDDIDLAMCSCKIINDCGSLRNDEDYLINKRDSIYELTPCIKEQVSVVLWNKIFKIDIIQKYSIEFINLKPHEDVNFIYKYLSFAKNINFTSACLYNYVYRLDSISEDMYNNNFYIDVYLSCFENLLDFLKNHNILEGNIKYFSIFLKMRCII